MASRYIPNEWELYDENLPEEQQPNSYITKRKLQRMEKGIEEANIELEVGEIKIGDRYEVSIVKDEVNKTKRLNMTFVPARKGDKGDKGESSYETWLREGNIGSEQDFINSLKGQKGDKGDKGDSAYEVWKTLPGNENKSLIEFYESLRGERGPAGPAGTAQFVDF